MDRHIENLMEMMFEFEIETEYLFRKVCGFTLAFRRKTSYLKAQMSSVEIEPVGIIYEENGEYYYAPLYEEVEIEEVIHEFVKDF